MAQRPDDMNYKCYLERLKSKLQLQKLMPE